MVETYLLALVIAVVVLVGFFVVLRRMPWEKRSHVAQTILGVAVILALTIAGLEYILHQQGDIDRKKQAVVDILVKTMGSNVFGPAYHALYDKEPKEVLKIPFTEFDEKIAPLSDIFSSVGVCAAADQCDKKIARKMFCYDFKTYEYAYNAVHPPGQRWQDFDREEHRVFCKCEDKHRFSTLSRAPPAPWARCGRKV